MCKWRRFWIIVAGVRANKTVFTLHYSYMKLCLCVCTDQWPPPPVCPLNEGMQGLNHSFLSFFLLPSPSFQRKGVKGGEMECVIERYKVPEEKKWTSSLMRTLALMQMGIDYHCRSVRRYLTLTGEECVCVCLHVRGHGCVFILRSIRCLFHLLHLSLYEQSLIILLSALMEFFGVFFPTYTYFFF